MKSSATLSSQAISGTALLLAALILYLYSTTVFANPEKFTGQLKNVIKGAASQVASKINGFYMAESKGYHSYVYVELSGDTLKAVYEYLEDGEKHRGFFKGKYLPEKGYAEGDICYEDLSEWHGKGGMAFYEKKGDIRMSIFYTETKKPSDNDWTNDWPHTKADAHPRLSVLKGKMENKAVQCVPEKS